MNDAEYQIIILAAGSGTRMNSNLPKVMHRVGDKSMLEYVLSNARAITQDIVLVHSRELLPYLHSMKPNCKLALQEQPLGTAHATSVACKLLIEGKINLVLYGDNPFIGPKIIQDLIDHLKSTQSSVVTLCFICDNPAQYGRIVKDNQGNLEKIVEYKDASIEEKKINLCNSGIMAFAPKILATYLPYCLQKDKNDSSVSEAYLTDIVKICKERGEKVSYFLSENTKAVIGINTQQELEQANKSLNHIITKNGIK